MTGPLVIRGKLASQYLILIFHIVESQPREIDQCMHIGYAVSSQGPYSTMVP
jgi:hypothetical protein